MAEKYIIELEEGVWLTNYGENDPGRTLVKEHAKTFYGDRMAKLALREARKYRPFTFARVVKVKP